MKSIRLRLYPNKVQEELFRKNCGCTRFIYNHFLDRKIKHYEKTGKTISAYDSIRELTELKTARAKLSFDVWSVDTRLTQMPTQLGTY